MVLADSFIENIAKAQTQFLSTYVFDKQLREPLQNMVDAQAELARVLVSITASGFNNFQKVFNYKQ